MSTPSPDQPGSPSYAALNDLKWEIFASLPSPLSAQTATSVKSVESDDGMAREEDRLTSTTASLQRQMLDADALEKRPPARAVRDGGSRPPAGSPRSSDGDAGSPRAPTDDALAGCCAYGCEELYWSPGDAHWLFGCFGAVDMCSCYDTRPASPPASPT